jgi:hypothetical protein
MSKFLVGVVACEAHRARMESQRKFWANNPDVDVVFFLGTGATKQQDNEVILDCPDDYAGLPLKVRAMFRWVLENGYDYALRCDSDVYLRPERLVVPVCDYAGRLRGPWGPEHPAPYCSGFAYWVSRKAMEAVVAAPAYPSDAEDVATGNILLKAGIIPVDLGHQYVVVKSDISASNGVEGPRKDNVVIAACEYKTDREMAEAHHEFMEDRCIPQPTIPMDDPLLSRVDILLKTFKRDGMLFRSIEAIQKNAPSARMVIIDDGAWGFRKTELYGRLRREGHACHHMPFDSGFGAKSNAAMLFYQREYVLIASDDFDFTPEAVEGIRDMVRASDDKFFSVVSGRVDGSAYEFHLLSYDDEVKELKPDYKNPFRCKTEDGSDKTLILHKCDLTVNYCLVRRDILGHGANQVHWDDDVKIGGGEHGAWFLDLKKAGHKVAYLEGANINQQGWWNGCEDPDYGMYRARAREPGRICLKRRGVNKYWCFGHPEPELT